MSTDLPVELEKRILQRLEDSADRNDIILELCESQGMDWREAEALLDSIHFHHAADITLRQSPLLVALALVFFLGGIGLIAYIAYDLVSFYRMLDEMPSHGSSSGPFGGLLVYLSIVGAQYSGMILLALAMIVGSIKGMENVWEAIFAKLGIFRG
jgi:hypothetical protein